MPGMLEKIFKNYSLGIVLFSFFVASWIGQGFTQWQAFVNNANEHNQEIRVGEFIPEFWSATLENWQSEFLQLFTMVVLTSMLSFKGSPESKDSEEKTQKALARIERVLKTKQGKK